MRNTPLIFLLFFLLVSCRQPVTVDDFRAGEGPYVFAVDLSDSTAAYDFDLYTRVDVPYPHEWASLPRELALEMVWKSPSGALFREKVYLPLAATVYEPYRADVRPAEPGEWTLTVYAPSAPDGFRGMGLVINKKSWATEN